MHKMAQPAALATIAAQNQGKFWQMHDAIFAGPSQQLSNKSLTKIAQKIGLDIKQFNKDLNSPETKQKLSKDLATARQAGVSGTPTMFINGRLIKNRAPNAIQQMIDQEVKKSKAASN